MLAPFGLPRPGPSQPDSHPMARHLSLVSQHAERLSRRFLEERESMIESYRVEFLDPIDGKLPLWQQDVPGLSAS